MTRRPGAAAVTAGPGVTNAISAIASAQANHSPMLVLGGRAPATRWGHGSLQEIDHVPLVATLTKLAATATRTADIPALVDAALGAATAAHGGPAFLDFPLDVVFSEAPDEGGSAPVPSVRARGAAGRVQPAGAAMDAAIALLREARRPVIMAGTDLYWAHGEKALRALVEALRIPVFLNGLARGCVPADHELFFSRARSEGLRGADVALLIGVPMDFRLGFGAALGEDTKIIAIDRVAPAHPYPRVVQAALFGDVSDVMDALRVALAGAGCADASRAWVDALRVAEDAARAGERELLSDARAPLHPMRVYGELVAMLDRDAIVIGDGGDFVSYAGRMIDSYEPGCWLDPGPYGCLGSGPGYALAAKLAHPGRQVVLLLGDGAFGFAGMEFDTLARHGVAVVGVIGNNGIWGLEKHPMEFIYGYSVAAELRPETRYDTVVEALGGQGALVREPAELRPALERAFAAQVPALVNVLTDPSVAYPRRSNLA